LRAALPPLPPREPCKRQVRQPAAALVAFVLPLVHLWVAQRCAYAALDSSGGPPREAKRRGAGGLPGLAAMGWSNRRGWDEGVQLRLAGHPGGLSTGCGLGPASSKAHPLAETGFALRGPPPPALASVGAPACGPSVVATGFAGPANQQTWGKASGAHVICPPQRQSRAPWPKRLRRGLAGVRQRVETVEEKLGHTCRLDRERPHALRGLQARVAAKRALQNFCGWFNEQLGRPRLAFTDVVDW
jgi:hypothetical protein